MKKVWIASILALIFTIAIFSGCLGSGKVPVVTLRAYENAVCRAFAEGQWSVFCKASDQCFVYDSRSHETWEDYRVIVKADMINHITKRWKSELLELLFGVTYYVRVIAYCYNFWGPLKNFEDGWYQGEELSFTNY